MKKTHATALLALLAFLGSGIALRQYLRNQLQPLNLESESPAALSVLRDQRFEPSLDNDRDRIFIGLPLEWRSTLSNLPNWQPIMTLPNDEVAIYWDRNAGKRILSFHLPLAQELPEVLSLLYQRGARRFAYFATATNEATGIPAGQVVAPTSGWVNTATGFGTSAVTQTQEASAVAKTRLPGLAHFIEFTEKHRTLEQSALVFAIGSDGSTPFKLAEILKSAIAHTPVTDPAAIPLSFSFCDPHGVCLRDRTFVEENGKARAGQVISIAYPHDPFMELLVQFDNRERKWYRSGKAALTREANCLPVHSRHCIGNEVSDAPFSQDRKGLRLAGIFPESGKKVGVGPDGILHLIEKTSDPTPDGAVNTGPITSRPTAELLRKIRMNEPTRLRDLLVNWNTPPSETRLLNPWKDCSNGKLQGFPLRTDTLERLAPDCMPDTLYSWTTESNIKMLEEQLGVRPWDESLGASGIYFASSPAASFGFGSYDESAGLAIRVKLKHGTEFRLTGNNGREIPDCQRFSEAEKQKTVFVRVWIFPNNPGVPEKETGRMETGLEFVLCSSAPIHSWSHSTREFFDELARDTLQAIEPGTSSTIQSYIRKRDSSGVFQPALLGTVTDAHPFTQEHLIQALRKHLLLAADGKGKVYLNPDEINPSKTNKHFETDHPSWFNPGASITKK